MASTGSLHHIARHGRRSVLAALCLLVVMVATAAGASAGDPFRLGVVNSISSALTRLTGSRTGALFQVDNQSTAAGARALKVVGKSPTAATLQARNDGGGPAADFIVDGAVPPFTVSSDARVPRLNADRLDGHDASGFVFGPGRLLASARSMSRGHQFQDILDTGDYLVEYSCPVNQGDLGEIWFTNMSGQAVNLFSDNGSADPTYRLLAASQSYGQQTWSGGERITFQVQGSGVTTIEVFSVHRGNPQDDCHAQVQAWGT